MSSKIATQAVTYAGAPISATAFLFSGTPFYTDAIDIKYSDGYAALLMVIAATGSPDLDISMQVSEDNVSWYTPYNSSGADASAIATALTADRFQALSLPLASYLRFKIDPDADTTLTLKYITKEHV